MRLQFKEAGEALALFSAMPTSTTTSSDLHRTVSSQVRCWRPHGQHGMCVPITSTPPTSQERPRLGGTPSEIILSLLEIATASRALVEIMGSSASSSAVLYTRWCAFCFVRVSMPPPNQTRAYLPCITCCTREKHTRAHMRALLPVRSRFCARSIACASLAPRRSLLREVLVPDHHPGHFGYFQLRLLALVASLLHGSVPA